MKKQRLVDQHWKVEPYDDEIYVSAAGGIVVCAWLSSDNKSPAWSISFTERLAIARSIVRDHNAELNLGYKAALTASEAQITALKAENERLKDALEEIDALELPRDAEGKHDFYSGPGKFFKASNIAHAALTASEEVEDGK
jgi:hypothetical protein